MRMLFLCVENSCRSQMAEGWARRLAPREIEVLSAGARPAAVVNTLAIEVMRERGIDISRHHPKPVPGRPVDYLVTMGCGDACPSPAAGHRIAWRIPDPRGGPVEQFRAVRDLIERQVRQLLQEIADGAAAERTGA